MWRFPRSIRYTTTALRLATARRVETSKAGLPRLRPQLAWRETGARHFHNALLVQQEALPLQPSPDDTPDVVLQSNPNLDFAKTLPVVCPGCGALSQIVDTDVPGFYSRKSSGQNRAKKEHEDAVFKQAMARLNTLDGGEPEVKAQETVVEPTAKPTICDRCHDLLYQSKGNSILHPSMDSIRDIIESSPHRHNHIYHVLDAADFPMSLIPNLMNTLELPRLRTQNRRSKTRQYMKDRMAEVSFIITRSDLLAPLKEQVDRMMPYLQEVLRDALGRTGRNVRLGNVRLVSAKRGWWTPVVKQEIWKRGGAGWVVGKVNVGKSALFEVVFPKGRNDETVEDARIRTLREAGATDEEMENDRVANEVMDEVKSRFSPKPAHCDEGLEDMNAALELNTETSDSHLQEDFTITKHHALDQNEVFKHEAEEAREEMEVQDEDDDSMDPLPPAQPETQYPQMPIVSDLPGTTASPIRVPFGNGKGELIDLPGVQRSSLETHVLPEHRSALVMKSRIVPEQHTLKPGSSLLIGGVIRITPKTEDLIVLACPFTPLKPHVTNTQKAQAIQTGHQEDGSAYTGTVESIATDTAKTRIKSAGTFKLEWDVTKARAGPVTDKTAGKQKAENLPFVVYGADILIEGVGWVELTCQVRRRRKPQFTDAMSTAFGDDGEPNVDVRPEVEVFTPKGKFIGVRRPMNAWLLGGPKKVPKHKQKARPRQTISMHRRREGGKLSSRAATQ